MTILEFHKTIEAFNQNINISEYVFQENLPELHEMTFCFWFEGQVRRHMSDPHIMSISIEGNGTSKGLSFVNIRALLSFVLCRYK